MSGIAGILGIADSSRVYANTVGQRVVYDAVTQLLSQYNADVAAQTRVFVGETTPLFQERYALPGGGRLQRLGNQAPSAAVKRTGKWDVAYPLESFGGFSIRKRIDFFVAMTGGHYWQWRKRFQYPQTDRFFCS